MGYLLETAEKLQNEQQLAREVVKANDLFVIYERIERGEELQDTDVRKLRRYLSQKAIRTLQEEGRLPEVLYSIIASIYKAYKKTDGLIGLGYTAEEALRMANTYRAEVRETMAKADVKARGYKEQLLTAIAIRRADVVDKSRNVIITPGEDKHDKDLLAEYSDNDFIYSDTFYEIIRGDKTEMTKSTARRYNSAITKWVYRQKARIFNAALPFMSRKSLGSILEVDKNMQVEGSLLSTVRPEKIREVVKTSGIYLYIYSTKQNPDKMTTPHFIFKIREDAEAQLKLSGLSRRNAKKAKDTLKTLRYLASYDILPEAIHQYMDERLSLDGMDYLLEEGLVIKELQDMDDIAKASILEERLEIEDIQRRIRENDDSVEAGFMVIHEVTDEELDALDRFLVTR